MKKYGLAALAAALALVACGSPELDAQRGAAACEEAGIAASSPGFAACVGDQVAKIEAARVEAGQAIAAGLSAYGQSGSYYTAQPIYQNRRLNCTSRQLGTTVYTDCH